MQIRIIGNNSNEGGVAKIITNSKIINGLQIHCHGVSPHFLLSRRESKKSMLDGLLLEKQVPQMTQTQQTESVSDTLRKRNSNTT